MEIGCFYSNIMAGVKEKGMTPEEALQIAADHGIRALDVAYTTIEQMTPEGILKQVKGCEMHISSVFAFFGCDVCTKAGYEEALEKMKAAMRLAKAAESIHFMPVPQKPMSLREEDQELFVAGTRKLFADLTAYGEEIGIQVIFENISRRDLPYGTCEDVEWLLEHNPDLGFAYDSGNFPLVGIDELEAAVRFADRTVYVHLKDLKVVEQSNLVRDGIAYDSLELGGGYLKLKEVLAFLKRKGYEGTVVIEINSDPNIFDRAMKSAEFLKSVF